MKNPRHAMIDLETMGKKPGCPIISIGVVLFDPRYNHISKRTFYRELDWQDQTQSYGLEICPETVEWWSKQSKETKAAHNGLDDLEEVLIELAEWLPKDVKVWGNGATFDITILEHCYDKLGVEIPWKFWNIRDCRTVLDMYESKRGGFNKKSGGTCHNALDDAYYQCEYINMMWKDILGEGK